MGTTPRADAAREPESLRDSSGAIERHVHMAAEYVNGRPAVRTSQIP